MMNKVCAREGCGSTFESYPSQNKKYCSSGCRYTDPVLRELLKSNIETRHSLTEIDEASWTAICANCGPTDIRERTERNRYPTTKKRWRCRGAERAARWARQYGLTSQEVFELLASQSDACAICNQNITWTFHVDHDHDSGKVRALLCSSCNTAIGLLGEDRARLEAAIRYLDLHGRA